ncbi:MAG TPA: MBL fold metallo-hydrolase [Candidatus Eisenbacteria bacterium]|nr:MBL fold metallo-hydrolase [Candidatus Eisenbacteria bacterium]
MCGINRRQFISRSSAFLSLAAETKLLAGPTPRGMPEAAHEDLVAPDVYFHEGDISDSADAVCNNGWIMFEDYVLVIDANFPAGAKLIISKIRALTDKPIRFAFDTHHHGDHAYGNQIFVENGGVPVAHTGVVEEMKRYETGYYRHEPGRWESAMKERADLKTTKLKPPSVLFSKDLIFDDGKHRVELMHLGVAHTHGDAVAWLPNERILFTGDMCVNGPYNFVGDGDVGKWIATLDAAKKLGAKIVCTGHGPRSVASVLDDQQAFFQALRDQVGIMMANAPAAESKAKIEMIRATLKSNSQIARFVSNRDAGTDDGLPSQVAKVYEELTGNKLAALAHDPHLAHHAHARSHGLPFA